MASPWFVLRVSLRLSGRSRVSVLPLDIRVLAEDGSLLRQLTLDPNRDYQPRGVRPGRLRLSTMS